MEPPGQREFLITSLRAASSRARLLTNTFDTIGSSLRHRMISCDEAVAWLNDEGLLAEIEYRPGMSTAGTRMSARKELFAPIPIRAFGDHQLSGRHWRVLAVIAFHDRLGKNGQGCWAGRKGLAQEAAISETHFSDAVSDLRRWGYVASEQNPTKRNQQIHRVIYDELGPKYGTNPTQLGPVNGTTRSQIRDQQGPDLKLQAIEQTSKPVLNIYSIEPNRLDTSGFNEEIAQKRAIEEARRRIEDTENYLSEVQLQLSDPITAPAVRCEYRKLAWIADSINFPDDIRSRAASLRDLARAA